MQRSISRQNISSRPRMRHSTKPSAWCMTPLYWVSFSWASTWCAISFHYRYNYWASLPRVLPLVFTSSVSSIIVILWYYTELSLCNVNIVLLIGQGRCPLYMGYCARQNACAAYFLCSLQLDIRGIILYPRSAKEVCSIRSKSISFLYIGLAMFSDFTDGFWHMT